MAPDVPAGSGDPTGGPANGWTDGYVTEIEYTNGFFGELAPPFLSFAMALRGFRPPDSDGFAYCELGCGHGYTANLLAAAHPGAVFDAVDFNPAHIANARALAADAGLGNIAFHEASFADFQRAGGRQYDCITMHGVWSWVGPETRAALLDLIRERLKPGGALYVSYNCLPGWAAQMPLRQLVALHTDDRDGPIAERLDGALDFIRRLSAHGCGYFGSAPEAARRAAGLDRLPRAYLAHEYLNRNWSPLYHADVARALAQAGLSFAGAAVPLEQIDAYAIPAAALPLLQEARDSAYRETLRDYLANTAFRRDVFVRDAGLLDEGERLERLRRTRFVLTAVRPDVPETMRVPLGTVALPQDLYGPLADALAEAPATLDELLLRPELGRHGLSRVLLALMVLTGLGKAATIPGAGDPEARRAATDRFNRAVIERDPLGRELPFLASPVLGTGVSIGRGEGLFLLAGMLGRDPAEFAWERLGALGHRISRDGRPVEDRDEGIAELRRRLGLFRERRLPLLERLGVA